VVPRYLFQLRAGKCGAGCAHGGWKYCPVDRDRARELGQTVAEICFKLRPLEGREVYPHWFATAGRALQGSETLFEPGADSVRVPNPSKRSLMATDPSFVTLKSSLPSTQVDLGALGGRDALILRLRGGSSGLSFDKY